MYLVWQFKVNAKIKTLQDLFGKSKSKAYFLFSWITLSVGLWFWILKNRSKGPVLIGLEEIVQRQVGVGVGRGR